MCNYMDVAHTTLFASIPSLVDSTPHMVYNARTWKPGARALGVPVVASSARKDACGAESAGLSNQVKLLGGEASTEA